jgi:hypothetical protein
VKPLGVLAFHSRLQYQEAFPGVEILLIKKKAIDKIEQ